MSTISLSDPQRGNVQGWQPFALGFRPFFLLAGVAAILLMGLWVGLWHGDLPAERYYGRVGWHTHEMLFGYTAAVIAGFLLTAVPNWTGVDTPRGAPLAGLALIWLIARLAPWWQGIPGVWVALMDLAFLPLLALALLRPLWLGVNRVNRIFLLFLGLMMAGNVMVHGEVLGVLSGWAWRGTQLMLDSILLLLVFVAGRVVPFFVERAVPGATPRLLRPLEVAGYLLFTLLILAHLLDAPSTMLAPLALVIGGVHALRLRAWWHGGIVRVPLLWVLFSGYLWLVLGFVALSGAYWGWLPRSSANHMLTVGGIGLLTLGMMARVTLGHTGREMKAPAAMELAFVFLNIAALLRAIGPWLVPDWWWIWYLVGGLFWIVAFTIFVTLYAPMLTRARVDGQAG